MPSSISPRGRALYALLAATISFLAMVPSVRAAWTEQKSWQVQGAYATSVAADGRVAILAAPVSISDPSVRVFNQQGRETSAFAAPGYVNRGLGIAFDEANIATVWGGGLDKVRITTTSPTGQVLSEIQPFGPEDQNSELDPFVAGLDIDARRDKYLSVSSNWSPAIQRFAADGTRIGAWGDGEGAGPGEFGQFAAVITSNGRGDVYALDPANNRVQQFTDQGAFVRQWGQTGTGEGQFWTPIAITTAPNGDVWVADDTKPRRVQRFTSAGKFIEEITLPDGTDDYGIIVGIDTDAAGRLYVVTGKPLYPGYVRIYAQSRRSAGGATVLSRALRYRKRKIAVRIRCTAKKACRGTLRIRKGKTTLGSRKYRIKAGRKATVSVRPSKRGRRVIARAKRHQVTVQLKPAKGKPVNVRLTLRR